MNVAIITSEYAPHNNQGGIATFTSSLAALLVRQGHRVFVITTVSHPDVTDDQTGNPVVIPMMRITQGTGIRALAASAPGKLFRRLLNKYFYSTTQLLIFTISSCITFSRLLRNQQIDIIHTPVLFAPALFIRMLYISIPLIVHAQGPDELLQPFDNVSFDTRIKAKIESLFMNRAAYIIPCSRSVYEYLKTRHAPLQNKLIYIPNFTEFSRFQEVSKAADINRLFFFGRLEFRKGPDLALKAFIALSRKYPALTLTFIGEDANTWKLHGKSVSFSAYVSALKLPISIRRRISFIPRIDDRQKLIRLMERRPGIAVLPSRYEPFGFVYIEAMAAGNITLASGEGGGSEILRNAVDGFTVNPTVENLVSQIDRIQTYQRGEIATLIRSAKSRIRSRYDVKPAYIAYERLYKRITIPQPNS